MRIVRVPLLLLIILTVMVGCSTSTKKNTGIALLTTKNIFVASATTAKRLCEQGVLSEQDCKEIEIIYARGREVLIEAKEVWDTMVMLDNFEANQDYSNLISKVARFTGVIETIIRRNR